MKEGQLVVATCVVTEGGDGNGDLCAKFPDPSYVHAVPGDFGTVVHVEPETDVHTVRFDRTDTATIVREDEVSVLTAEDTGMPTLPLYHSKWDCDTGLYLKPDGELCYALDGIDVTREEFLAGLVEKKQYTALRIMKLLEIEGTPAREELKKFRADATTARAEEDSLATKCVKVNSDSDAIPWPWKQIEKDIRQLQSLQAREVEVLGRFRVPVAMLGPAPQTLADLNRGSTPAYAEAPVTPRTLDAVYEVGQAKGQGVEAGGGSRAMSVPEKRGG
jgi:hypothetical protein